MRASLDLMMLMACAVSLASCAAVPRSVSQSLEIEAVTPLGAPVPGARCQLRQGGAEWDVVPPARATVISAGDDLLVRCEAGVGAARGEVRLKAQVRDGRGMRALIGAGVGGILGGAIGAAQDSSNRNNMCCGDLGRVSGALFGLGLGALAGALSADPAFEYPVKVRVTLEPLVPEATKP
jgi:hypothetical protein